MNPSLAALFCRVASAGAVLVIAATLAAQRAPAGGAQGPGAQGPGAQGPGAQGRGAQGAGPGVQKFKPMPTPRAMVPHRGGSRLTIDGSLRDWPDAPVLTLDDPRQLSGTAMKAWRGSRDFSARLFLLWDEEYLWLAAVVRDDWHRPLDGKSARGSESPPADNLVLTIDPRRDTRAIGRDPGREEDRTYWIADVKGQDRKVVLWDRLRGSAGFSEGALAFVVHDRDERQTYYEARLPWSEMLPGDAPKPAARQVFDLQLVFNDYDDPTDPLPQTRVGWTFGTGPRIDPGLFGGIMLWPKDQKIDSLPELPSTPPIAEDPVPGPAFWNRLHADIHATEPTPLTRDSGAPAAVLGDDRLSALQRLDRQLAQFPRVDVMEYQMLLHRRMNRELNGMVRTGLPYYWDHVVAELKNDALETPPEHGFRVYRLPLGGFLVRSRKGNFAIDPSTYRVDTRLYDGLDFVLLTRPLDPFERSDQLLQRLLLARRRFVTHARFHLPGLPMDRMPIAKIGETYTAGELKIQPLGQVAEDGKVTLSTAYRITWPDGSSLVASGTSYDPAEWPAAQRTDVLLLSSRHPSARQFAQRVGAGMTVLDDVFEPPQRRGANARTSLRDAFELQNQLRPFRSVLLAPGEYADSPVK